MCQHKQTLPAFNSQSAWCGRVKSNSGEGKWKQQSLRYAKLLRLLSDLWQVKLNKYRLAHRSAAERQWCHPVIWSQKLLPSFEITSASGICTTPANRHIFCVSACNLQFPQQNCSEQLLADSLQKMQFLPFFIAGTIASCHSAETFPQHYCTSKRTSYRPRVMDTNPCPKFCRHALRPQITFRFSKFFFCGSTHFPSCHLILQHWSRGLVLSPVASVEQRFSKLPSTTALCQWIFCG